MRDCPNATMRELLPDLMHDRIGAAQRAELRAHLAACADCRAELLLLEQVRAGAPTPRVDIERIVAVLPAYTARSIWSGRPASLMRIAAAILLVAGGAAITMNARRNQVAAPSQDTVPQVVAPRQDTVQQVAAVTPQAELAVGETLQDVSDSDLRLLLDELATFEAVTPSETEVVVTPAISTRGS